MWGGGLFEREEEVCQEVALRICFGRSKPPFLPPRRTPGLLGKRLDTVHKHFLQVYVCVYIYTRISNIYKVGDRVFGCVFC